MPDKKKKRDARLSLELNRPLFADPTDPCSTYARDLINAYIRSHDYRGLAVATRRNYRRALKIIGSLDGNDLAIVQIHKLLCGLKPGMAAQLISTGSAMCTAMNVDNPFKLLKKPKCGEWEAWTPEDVHHAGCRFTGSTRLLLFLGAFTGQRVSDIQIMQWPELQNFKTLEEAADRVIRSGMLITIKQQKTGAEVFVPIPSTLFLYFADLIMAEPRAMLRDMLAQAHGWHSNNWLFPTSNLDGMTRSLSAITGKPFHGLRKTCSVLLAEGECSPHEIAAVTGHKTIAMLVKYTRTAEKKRLAMSAMAKMQKRLDAQEVTI